MLRCVFDQMNVVRRELRRFGMKIKPVLLRLPFQGQTAENRLFLTQTKHAEKKAQPQSRPARTKGSAIRKRPQAEVMPNTFDWLTRMAPPAGISLAALYACFGAKTSHTLLTGIYKRITILIEKR